MTIGIILGRFIPPHLGHQYLIDFARSMTDMLILFVCSLQSDPIEGALRCEWIKAMGESDLSSQFPKKRIKVIHITEEIPEAHRDDPNAPKIWARTILQKLKTPPDMLFASEPYGWELAQHIGCQFIPVNPARTVFPISSSQIRNNLYAHWHYLPQAVRTHFLRRVAVITPDAPLSVTPPSFTARLAEKFSTVVADNDIHHLDIDTNVNKEIQTIIATQIAIEEALTIHANRVMICHTSPFTMSAGTPSLSEVQYQKALSALQDRYDLHIFVETSPPHKFSKNRRTIIVPHDEGGIQLAIKEINKLLHAPLD